MCIAMFYSCHDAVPDFPVKYRVTFTSTWTNASHPVDYPPDAAFSPFICYSHKANSALFDLGLVAPGGIPDFSTSGSVRGVVTDIDLLRSAGKALDRSQGDGVVYPQVSEVFLGFDDDHTYCSVLSHIVPSPDWFIGAINVQLKTTAGWVDTTAVLTVAYDAGVDGGTTFNSTPNPTIPPQPVKIINSAPLANNGTVRSMATISFKKVK